MYSLGANRTDDRGQIVRAVSATESGDIGFQLWDADLRRATAN